MAETTNVALKKIAGSENWRNIFDHYNNSMDIADDEINTIENAIAILANGNTHVAITTGQRVYVRNHDTLASGLYKATADIAANKVLSSSNLEAEPDGGLNSLAEDIATNASDIASQNQALTNIQNGLAIMANGDTHAAIAAGKAVYVRNHSTLADGLYWATAAIATNGALSTSNLAADASGGLNKLKGDIDSLNSKLENAESFSLALPSGWQAAGLTAKKYLNIVFLQGLFEYSEGTTEKAIDLGNCIPSTYASLKRCDFIAFDNSTDEPIHGIISGKSIKLFRTATTSIKTITFNACYLT